MRLIDFLDGATPSIGAVREGRSVARLAGIGEFYAEPSAWLAGASSVPVAHGVGFVRKPPRYLCHGRPLPRVAGDPGLCQAMTCTGFSR